MANSYINIGGYKVSTSPKIITVSTNTTLNFTVEAAVNITASATLTLGTAPYLGYKVKVMNGRDSGTVYVHYNGLVSSQFDDAIYTDDSITYEYYGSGTWKPMDGTVYRAFSSLPSTYNEWKTYRGPGTYTFFYSYTGAATDHDLPSSFCTVTVVWGASTTASVSAVQNYHSAGNESTAVTMWTRNMGAGTWSEWFKIAPGGSGTLHTVTSLASGWTGTVYWVVRNGICMLCNYAQCSSTGTSKTILTNVPKSKMTMFTATYGNRGGVYIDKDSTTLRAHVTTASANLAACLTYPVADDWVEP